MPPAGIEPATIPFRKCDIGCLFVSFFKGHPRLFNGVLNRIKLLLNPYADGRIRTCEGINTHFVAITPSVPLSAWMYGLLKIKK